MILDHPIISERYFYPRAASPVDPFLVDCGDAELACCLHAPHDDAPILVHFHGNGEVVADYESDYTEAVTGLGVNLLLVEYRGYGGSTGTPALARMLDDVDPVCDALERPECELIIYGRSVGALYAMEMAHRHPGVAGLILESGIADVHERLLLRVEPEELGVTAAELERAVAERFDNQRKLANYPGPLLVMHARDDDLVDWSHARRNHAWGGGEDKELVLFDWGGHNGLLSTNWPRYLETLGRFIDKVRANTV